MKTTFFGMVRFVAAWVVGSVSLGAADQKVSIKGSNTFGEELAPMLVREYRQTHPTAVIEVAAKGSASGFAALIAGDCDIASSSRPIDEKERQLAVARGIKVKSSLIGYYGVAVIVNPGNPLGGLKREQVRDVFTGVLTNWKLLGGPDAPIHLCIRAIQSGTNLGFRELAMENRAYASGAKSLLRYAEIAEAVRTDPLAIGYVSMAMAEHRDVKALRIDSVFPSVFSVNNSDYPYARGLRLNYNGERLTPAAQEFLRFVVSDAGQEVLSLFGFVRVAEPRLASSLDP